MLSKSGYGKVEDILNTRCDLVLAMLEYENFLNEYEETVSHINKETDK